MVKEAIDPFILMSREDTARFEQMRIRRKAATKEVLDKFKPKPARKRKAKK